MWTCWVMRLMAVLSTNMLTVNMLLSVFFLPGVLDACSLHSDLFITAPLKMEALSGSCLQIPCNFSVRVAEEFDGSRETIGVWIKYNPYFKQNSKNVIFNSSQTDNTYPMKITGNLKEKNCTTLFSYLITTYTDKYYFRIENRPFKQTAVCDPLHITVTDSPPSPTIEISGELKEKESVTITCSAFTPCPHSPPKLTWNLQQDAHNTIEENTDRTFTTKIQKTITLSDKHDGYTITCSSIYSVNEGHNVKSAEGKETLSVPYAPKDTSAMISPSGLVSPGSWVNLTCSSRAKPAANFIWFKTNKDGLMKVSEGDFYSFNVTDGGIYYCVATNDVGHQMSSEIHLTIKDSPPSPTIEISGEQKEKESVTITCSAFTPCPHSPPKLTWNLQQDAHNTIEENTDRTFTTKIQKTITLSDKHDGYTITCSSNYSVNEGQNVKSAERKVTLSVPYAPKDTSAMISPSGLVSPGSWVNLTWSSRAKPAANFTWFKINKDGHMKVSEGDFYSFNVTDGGIYYCVATNDVGNQSSSKIHLTIKAQGLDLGGIIGIIILIFLVVSVCTLMFLKWFKSTHPQQTESQTDEEELAKTEEGIHYGEINFSKQRPGQSSDSVQASREQQDIVYEQVKVSTPQTADGPEELYAQVKKT
ncbi:B-cell receptor CD22-like [Scomber japonicus]|uniref:B-cell receptor CD22-like n=1 Tax=Scomber japonicus TaxID=13676 RepID=UPI0023068B0B|nr:B-cell receptor CD22-like [Scomber japonicus]